MAHLLSAQVPTTFLDIETEGGTHWQAGRGGCIERPLEAGPLVKHTPEGVAVKLGMMTASGPAVPQ
jgi:hypothetical protein